MKQTRMAVVSWLLLCMLFPAAAYSAAPVFLSKEEQTYRSNHPILRVSNEMDWPPIDYAIDGQPAGYSVSLLKLLAEKAGFQVEFHNGYSWSELLRMFNNHELDLIHPLGRTTERMKLMRFGNKPIEQLRSAIFTTIDNSHLRTLNDLKGKTISMGEGWSTVSVLKKNHPDIKIRLYPSTLEMLSAVSRGEVDATIETQVVSNFLIQQHGLTNVLPTGFVSLGDPSEENAYWAVQNDNALLKSILDKAHASVTVEEISQLRSTWFGSSQIVSDSRTLNLTEEERTKLDNLPEIRFCFDPDWMPYEALTPEGLFTGMVSDYVKLMAERLDITMTVTEAKDWDDAIQKAKNRECDMLTAVTPSDEMLNYFNFTDAYFENILVIATRHEEGFLKSIQDLDSRKVAMVGGWTITEEFKIKYPDLNIIETEGMEDALEGVRTGEYYAMIDVASAISYYIRKKEFYDLKISGRLEGAWPVGMAVRNDDPLLGVIINKALASVSEEERRGIEKKWIDVEVDQGIDIDKVREWSIKIGALALLIFAGILFWYRRMSDEITKRKLAEQELLLTQQKLESNVRERTRELEFSEVRLSQFHNSSREAIFFHDKDKFIDTNPAAQVLFGYSNEEMIGRSAFEFIHPDDHSILEKNTTDGYEKPYEIRAVNKDNQVFWIEVLGRRLEIQNEILHTVAVRDISERKEYEDILKLIAEGVSSEIGQKFFEQLAVLLAQYLKVDYIIIGRYSNLDERSISTLAVSSGDQLLDNMTYNLKGTPCEQVMETGVCLYPDNVFGQFPTDMLLQDMDAESYAGIPLHSTSGEPLGILVSISKTKMQRSAKLISLLKIFALRAASELERIQTEEALVAANDELEQRVVLRTEEVERQSLLLEVTLENLTQGITLFDTEMNLSLYNRRAQELLGFPDYIMRDGAAFEEGIRFNANRGDFGDADTEKIVEQRISDMRTFKAFRYERERPNGTVLEIIGTPIEQVGFVTTYSDVTERANAERASKLAREDAEKATRIKSEFLANMSHEIRTPMNAVIGFSHLALQTNLTHQQTEYIQKIQRSSQNLLRIINDILDFSKIEAGKLEIEQIPFSLDDVMDHLCDLLRLKADEKGLEVLIAYDWALPRNLIGDPLRLGQVLTNLATNAVKFTDEGNVLVKVKQLEQNEDELILMFEVTDTGIGMHEDELSRLFRSFSQADSSTTRQYGGSGLGLAISKQLVNLMQGDIHVESTKAIGSCFSFSCRLGIDQEATNAAELPLPLSGYRALVVDDSDVSRTVLSEQVRSFGMEVETVASGEQALETLRATYQDRRKHVDIVLLDWQMPELDGLACAREIQKLSTTDKTPAIVMVSAYAQEKIYNQLEENNLQDYLLKPIRPKQLLTSIESALGKEPRKTASSSGQARRTSDSLAGILGAQILVVEDNETNQQIARELLQSNGLHVDIAENGQKGIAAAKLKHYDLVLMDIQMPVMDGLEATMRLRGEYTPEELPIVAMTANAMSADHDRSINAGMNDHIDKPISPDILFSTLIKWIKPGQREVTRNTPQPPAKNSDFPTELPGLSLEAALERVAGNQTLLEKLLLSFYRDNRDIESQLMTLFDSHDFQLASEKVHTLIGGLGNLGAENLATSAGALEVKLRQKVSDPTLEQAFMAQLTVVMDGLASLESPSTQVMNVDKNPTESSASVSQIYSQFEQMLIDGDSRSENKLTELEYALLGKFPSEFKQLAEQIEEYEFDAALSILKQLKQIWEADGHGE